MNHPSTKKLAYAGLSAALIAVLTAFVRLYIPMSHGYAHLGDSAILLSGALLGPFAYLPAGIGSALADVLCGYAVYAPFTFAIKAVMGALAGRFITGRKARNALVCAGISAFMVAGYFAVDAILYGFAAALSSVIGNFVQGVASTLLALFLIPHLKKPEV